MRRPLKPFVTEYKGSNRRGLAGSEPHEADRPKSFDFTPKPDNDDSYDAAMRAADALFSIPSAEKTTHAKVAPEDDAPKPGGRILRVIDEDPSPAYAAIEAERAPKRRGRKPGSKNKPKTLVALQDDAPAPTPRPNGKAYAQRPAADPAALSAPQTIPAIATLAALPNTSPAPTKTNSFAARDEKRFPWVRDRLKPGEAWKRRRLPRVCW